MATAAELIAAAEAATTNEELDDIESLAEERVTVLNAIDDARERLAAPPEPVQNKQPSGETTAHTTDPDFVWVGCTTCWHPRDESRPVRAYSEWLADGMRYLTYTCLTCSDNSQLQTIEVFPSLFGYWMEDAVAWQEGGPAPQPTEVRRG